MRFITNLTSGTIFVNSTISAGNFAGALVTSSNLGALNASIGTLITNAISTSNIQLSGTISAAALVGSLVSVGSIGAAGATVGTLYATSAQVSGVASAGSFGAAGATIGTLYATNNTNASIILNDSRIRLRSTDDNHGLQYNAALDGPKMWGFSGGALGYGGINGSNVLTWYSSGITVNGNVSAGSVGAAGATIGTLYATAITSANAQVSGTVSSGTFAGALMTAGSVGAAGATIGTLYATTITASNLYVSGSVVSVNVTTLNLIDNNISSGALIVSGNTSLGSAVVSGTISAGTVRASNLWVNGSALNAQDGTRSSLVLPGGNTVWSSDLNYNFNVNGLIVGTSGATVNGTVSAGSLGAAGITTGTLYASSITAANAQLSGTISAGTHVGSLFSAGSLGAAGITVGTIYATTMTGATLQLSGTISAGTHVGSLFSAGSIGASGATIGTIYVSNITGSTAQFSGIVSAGTLQATNVTGKANGASINVTNINDTAETSIKFYSNTTSGAWYVGQNVGSIGTGNFAIYRDGMGNIITALTTGNVGIRTNAPLYTFDVNGTVNAASGFTGGSITVSGSVKGNDIVLQKQGSTILLQGDNLRPGGLETVYNGVNFGSDIRLDCNNTFSSSPNYNLSQNGATFSLSCVHNPFQWNYRGSGQTTGNAIMSLSTSGYLGIGTTTPQYTLDVSTGSVNASSYTGGNMQVSGTVSAGTFAGALMTAGSVGAAGATVGTLYATSAQISGVASAGSIGAGGATIGNIYATNETMTNATIGSLQAGTTNINYNGGVSGLRLNNLTPGSETSIFYNSGNTSSSWYVGQNVGAISSGNFGFYNNALGTVVTILGTNGNMGVGTTVPAYKLDVNGTANASAYTGGNMQLSGTVSAGTHVGALMSAGSIGASGATIGTLYATTITASNLYVSGSVVSVNVTTLNLIDNNISSGALIVSGNTSLGSAVVSGTISAGTVRASNLWVNGSALNAQDGTRSSLILPGGNTVWSSDLNYNFNVNGLIVGTSGATVNGTVSAGTFTGALMTAGSVGAAGITTGTLYASSITAANAQLSGTISAGTLATPLITSSSLGVAGATVGTLYSNNISMNYMSVDSGRMVGAKNQTAANITGFNFSNSHDSFISYLTIRTPGASEVLTLIGFKTPGLNTWRMDQVSSGDYTDVPVDITTSGQIIYSAPDAGVSGPTFSWFTQRFIT